jgi:hypothetical protein
MRFRTRLIELIRQSNPTPGRNLGGRSKILAICQLRDPGTMRASSLMKRSVVGVGNNS